MITTKSISTEKRGLKATLVSFDFYNVKIRIVILFPYILILLVKIISVLFQF